MKKKFDIIFLITVTLICSLASCGFGGGKAENETSDYDDDTGNIAEFTSPGLNEVSVHIDSTESIEEFVPPGPDEIHPVYVPPAPERHIDLDCPELKPAEFGYVDYGHWLARLNIHGFEEGRNDRILNETSFQLRGTYEIGFGGGRYNVGFSRIEIEHNGKLTGRYEMYDGHSDTYFFTSSLELDEGENEVIFTMFFPELNEYYQRVLSLYVDTSIGTESMPNPVIRSIATDCGMRIRRNSVNYFNEPATIIVTVEDGEGADTRVFVYNENQSRWLTEAENVGDGIYTFDTGVVSDFVSEIIVIAENQWGRTSTRAFSTRTPEDSDTVRGISAPLNRPVSYTLSDIFESPENLEFETNIGEINDGVWSYTATELGLFLVEIVGRGEGFEEIKRFWVRTR